MSKEKLSAPGLKRRKRADGEVRYWLPRASDIKRGYPLKSLTIPADLNEEEAAALCRKHQAELQAWRDGVEKGPPPNSFSWLVDRYLSHELSPFQKLGFKTQQNYALDCKIIKANIGNVRLDMDGEDAITGDDIAGWHLNWGKPGPDGKATASSRAHHVVTMLRILVKYAVRCGVPGAVALNAMLAEMEFSLPPPRQIVPEFPQVMALVRTALEKGFRSIAITTLAQFEFTERRISIIGQWEEDDSGRPVWRPGWVWQSVTNDWMIDYTQNKVGEVKRQYDLKATPLLLELIQRTPEDKRIGPVIICERTGKPWKQRLYNTYFRQIARAAGVPDELYSMDMRAGGATESDAVGVTDREMQDSGGWLNAKTPQRYRRKKERNAQNVVKLRQKARES